MARWKIDNKGVSMDATKSIAALVYPPDSVEAYWANSLAVGAIIACFQQI